MKQSILAGLIGVAILIALELVTRIALAISLGIPVAVFGFEAWPGFLWAFLLLFLSLPFSVLAAYITMVSGRQNKLASFILYVFFLLVAKYGQIHLLIGKETLIYPVLSLAFAVTGAMLAWIYFQPPAPKKADHHPVHESTPAGDSV
ncbi:MAG: hypothetical protein ACNA78_07140 [Balneolaceae bacterium]